MVSAGQHVLGSATECKVRLSPTQVRSIRDTVLTMRSNESAVAGRAKKRARTQERLAARVS